MSSQTDVRRVNLATLQKMKHRGEKFAALQGEFDETRYGFRTLTEMAHEAQKAGLIAMQRDRVGAWRVMEGA